MESHTESVLLAHFEDETEPRRLLAVQRVGSEDLVLYVINEKKILLAFGHGLQCWWNSKRWPVLITFRKGYVRTILATMHSCCSTLTGPRNEMGERR